MKYKYNGQWYDVSIKALDGMPIGAIIAYPSNNIPNGWLECNGSTITSTNYPELYDLIGGTLPNLKGRVIVGQDTSQTEFDTLGETGGSKALQEHTHNLGGQAVALNGTHQQVQNTGMTGGGMWGPSTFGLNTSNTATAGTGNSGNLQPYVVYKWIIKAKQTTPLIASVVNSNSASTTDTYSCDYINNKDSYSTTEIDTGKKWIDGKKIYRKVLTFTTNSSTGWSYQTHGISGINYVINQSMVILHAGNLYQCPNDVCIEIYTNGTNFAYYLNSATLGGKEAFAILEYTKSS